MSTINDYPDSLSLSGNLKSFVIGSSAEVVFILYQGATEILNEKYQPDATNLLTIDIKAVVERLLEVTVPTTNDKVTEQTAGVADFTASVDGTDIDFRVIKGGVSELVEMAYDWLYDHFLTWQPQTKYILQTQPEWLGIYPVANGNLVIKAYYDTGSYEAVYTNLTKDKLYSINVSWGVVSAWLAAVPQSQTKTALAWDISFSIPGIGVTIAERRYQLRDSGDAEHCYVWVNTLGGVDSVSFTGYQEEDYKLEHLNALYPDDTIFEYDIDQAREIRQSTGFLTDQERRWIADFFYSRTKYVLRTDGALKQIAVVTSKIISVNSNDEFDLEFSYRFTADSQYLNLDITPETLPAPVGLDGFFLTALLSGLTDATYAENLLMAVQSPYASYWQKLSLSQLWAGALPSLVDGISVYYANGKLHATGIGGGLDDVLATPGTYGSATQMVELTVTAQGRITAIQEHNIEELTDLDCISFEWWALEPGTSQIFDVDIKASYGYIIEGAVLETDNGTLTGVAVKIGATAVTGLASVTVDTAADETASTAAKTVVAGDRVTVVTSTGYTGTPSMIKGKLIIKKPVNRFVGGATSDTATVALVADEDKDYDTGSAVKPKFIQVFDANGVTLGFERSFSTTYKIKIFATVTTQDAEVNIIY